jgi:uncharacterized Zn-binding protein involved in type VI secretion
MARFPGRDRAVPGLRNGDPCDPVPRTQDLVIETGKPTGYIMSVDGFLGMGERDVVVDPSSVALTGDTGAETWKVSVSTGKCALKAAPGFKYDGKFERRA